MYSQNKTSTSHQVAPVVSVEWLKDNVGVTSDVRVLDVSWSSEQSMREEYSKCHIPGAAYFDIMQHVTNTPLRPRNLPTPEAFEAQVQSVGVSRDTHVIVYDSLPDNCGFFIGGRAWWMFMLHGHEKVSVLDGGLPAWKAAGLPTEKEVPQYQPGDFKVSIRPALLTEFESMSDNLTTPSFQVIDSRPSDAYCGKPEDQKTGHYPGAKSVPMSTLLDKDTGRLKPADALKQALEKSGVDLTKPIVTHCNSGMSSCTLALAVTMCGGTSASVYHGGFTEWRLKADEGQIEQA